MARHAPARFDQATMSICHDLITINADCCLEVAQPSGSSPYQTELMMLRDRDWQATGDLTRAQLVMFHALGDQIHLSEEDRRRALNLDDRTWMAWVKFLADGPLPAEPAAQEMLRRLGKAAFELMIMAEPVHGNSVP